jgi:hypothetical protein
MGLGSGSIAKIISVRRRNREVENCSETDDLVYEPCPPNKILSVIAIYAGG